MKRLACSNTPTLDDLLKMAAAFDEGRTILDPCEIHELVNSTLTVAQANLGMDFNLCIGSACLQKDSSGNVTLHLRRCGLVQRALSKNKQQSA